MVLLCDGTLEIEEYQRLTDKERAAQHLLGDMASPPLTRDVLLGELERASVLLTDS